MSLIETLSQKINVTGGLIVSCQPVPGSPLDKPEIVAAMALAAEHADALAVRIEGLANLRAARPLLSIPVIGIIKRLAMADCSSPEDGRYCQHLGAEFIGSTLSGYLTPDTPDEPDLALVRALSEAGCRVIADGRYNSPELAAQAMQHGAWAVTVGSAITRLEHICQWFNDAMREVRHDNPGH